MRPEEVAKLEALIEKHGGEVTDAPTGIAFALVLRRVDHEGPMPAHGREATCDRCREPVIVSVFTLQCSPEAQLVCTVCLTAEEDISGVMIPTVNLAPRLEADALAEKKGAEQ